ncbi:spectrin beta chain, brain [Thalictrum thalictroides]|uniref:Spectrin beta chain, brain n=1 Tax=Thalictrum thalictroides TaxID=46969 RepID=A0A7J6X8Y5_THATH|nr:spectrin beta chain, brain [Thalictrum thalictroides]
MAGSTRFELAAGSPEGSSFPSTYPNGQRGNYSGASLDRSGSFREGVENRTLNSGPGSSRGSTPLSVETSPSQFLNLEQILPADQKFTRSGELRRALGVTLTSTSEDHSFGAAYSKLPPPIAAEDIKRFKASVLDTYTKTRDRSKKLTESIAKLDKYRQVLSSKKRRTDISERSGGAGMLKIGNSNHQSPSDIVTQRLEDRNKNVVLNKRVRTSLAESEGRNTTISRHPLAMDKDRDMLRACNGGSLLGEEKIRGLPASGEGWDKKMKRKRSVGTVVTRVIEGERELKRAMHQKLSNDPRPRPYDANGFGSGTSNGITGMNKLDGTSQPSTPNGRVISRNEVENASYSIDRRERVPGMDKERALPKGNKPNVREDILVGSPSPVTKGKVSRAPRTGSGVANSSPSFSRTPAALDGWEQPSCLNKAQSAGGTTNRKRAIPAGSSSPPMAQWVGQRQQKSSRTRRANLISPVSNHDEAQISSEGIPDFGARLITNEANGTLIPKGVSSNTQHLKMKFENVPSPARLSESEESGAGENKLKEKGMDHEETEERSVNPVQKTGSVLLPMKKNRMLSKEEIGDGVRRQGRSGRGSSISRACPPHMREKLENPVTAKPLQSTKLGSDKTESKSGRPPSKKSADRKPFSRPGHVLNSGSSDMTGESDDDHEELLAAASSVHSAQYLACSGSFWKKIEPIFALVSSEDAAYLKQQLSFAEELDESLHHMFGADFSTLDELVHNEVASPLSVVSKDRQGIYLNGVGSKGPAGNSASVDHFQKSTSSGKFNRERSEEVTPLYQRVLSALIGEDEVEEYDRSSESRHASFQCASDLVDVEDRDRVDSEVDSEVDFRIQKNYVFDSFSCDGSTASNSFRSSSIHNPPYSDELWPGDEQSQPVHGNNVNSHSLECPYEQMSLDDKLLLELQSIGLYPEAVPDLAEGEEEEINKDIVALKEGLYQQVGKKKGQLSKIDEVIQNGREAEERNLERSAMNKLVEMAYKKRMACRGNNGPKSGVNRVSKQAALAFVKRTIARCRKFEETGKSCFSEPALRDTIFSACTNDAKLINAACANPCVEVHTSQPESRASAVGTISTSVEKHGPFGDKLDRGLSDAFQALPHSSDQEFIKQESISNRGKKKEVLLDEVTGNASSRASPALGSTLTGGAKGRRSERERDSNKFMSTRNSVAKAGRPALGGLRGERKNKTKPKQKTAQLSTSGNGLLGRAMEATNAVSPSLNSSNEKVHSASNKPSREVGLQQPGNAPQGLSKETEKPVDFTNLHLHELDSIEELGVSGNLGGHNDLSTWLNFDEDGLQDHDSMGLEIPMDDLSELNMLI